MRPLSRRRFFGLPVVLPVAAMVRPPVDPHAAHVAQLETLINRQIAQLERARRKRAALVRLYDEVVDAHSFRTLQQARPYAQSRVLMVGAAKAECDPSDVDPPVEVDDRELAWEG